MTSLGYACTFEGAGLHPVLSRAPRVTEGDYGVAPGSNRSCAGLAAGTVSHDSFHRGGVRFKPGRRGVAWGLT